MIEGPDRPSGQSAYHYRRLLDPAELVPAVAVGVAAGLVAFYLARLLIERTPLAREESIPVVGTGGGIVRRPRRSPGG